MRYRWIIIMTVVIDLLVAAGSIAPVLAASTVNVDYTVPAAATATVPPAAGGGSPASPPSISNVVSSTSFTTATFNWSAVANSGNSITNVAFVFGHDINYGSSALVVGSYQANLSALATGTVYYFKISVTDSANNITDYAGSFATRYSVALPDTTPPVISNILVSAGTTTSSISWNTDEPADSQINYGPTVAYGGTAFVIDKLLLHRLSVSSLLPNTTYHYRLLSADPTGNTAAAADTTFTTNKDDVPPPDVSGLRAATTTDSIILTWANPSLVAVPDFVGVKVTRSISGAELGATIVYTGNAETFTDTGALPNVGYVYTVFSVDTSQNRSPGIFANAEIIRSASPVPPPAPEICNNGIDDDGNGRIDCADSACADDPTCQIVPIQEICDNNIDDNRNGQTDCADSACFGFGGCVGASVPQYTPPVGTVSSAVKISAADLIFLAGNRQITLALKNGVLSSLANTALTIEVPKKVLLLTPLSLVVKVDGVDQHQLVYDPRIDAYYSDIMFPRVGRHQISLEIDYGNSQLDVVSFEANALAAGNVTADNLHLSEAKVEVLLENGTPFDTQSFGETNPTPTDINGTYGLVVPNGRYQIVVSKKGFYDYSSPLTVENNVINTDLSLVSRPPSLSDVIDPNAPLLDNIENVANNLFEKGKAFSKLAGKKIVDTAKVLQAIADKPEVKKAASQVVAPTTVGVVAVGTVSLVSWTELVSLLKFLFLQPLLLLGLRKRQGWGQVYNSLNKLPIDLATIRLVNVDTNKIIQSKVTDKKGRYAFVVDPGNYRLEVSKGGMVFPSALLAGYKDDGRRTDVYHSEIIIVKEEGAVITANIPLDPAGETKKPRRLLFEKIARKIQNGVSWVGLVVTGISLYIAPRWYVWVLFGLHIGIFLLFRRLAKPPKIKSWGIVYDEATKKPLARTVARLFSSQFNKLVATQVTDSRGRYYFLAGDNQYYVTYEHGDYAPHQTDLIDLSGKEAETITANVPLAKVDIAAGQQPTSQSV